MGKEELHVQSLCTFNVVAVTIGCGDYSFCQVFANSIGNLADTLFACDHYRFPLYHEAFSQNNIIVNDEYRFLV